MARPRTLTAKAAAIQDCLLGEADLGGAVLLDPSLPASADGAGSSPAMDAGSRGGDDASELLGDDGGDAWDSGTPRLGAVDNSAEATDGGPVAAGVQGPGADESDPLARFSPLLEELGAVSAGGVLWARPGAGVLVVGTGGPPTDESLVDQVDGAVEVWSLDDASEAVDVVHAIGHGGDSVGPMLGSRPLLVRGRARVTDEGSFYVEAEEIVELEQLWSDWTDSRVA